MSLPSVLFRGFEAADTKLISAQSLAEQGNPIEGASDARRPVNGYSALIDYLKKDLQSDIRVKSRVTRVAWSETSVRVFDDGGNEYPADAIVVTVPLSIIQSDTIVFEPDIPRMRRAAGKLVMGHVMRVCIVVKERFWEKEIAHVSFVHAPARPFSVWWTQYPLQANLIVGWSGGPPAMELTESGDVENVAVHELGHSFNMKRGRVEDLIDAIYVHDWTRDELARGAYSYAAVGGANAARALGRS